MDIKYLFSDSEEEIPCVFECQYGCNSCVTYPSVKNAENANKIKENSGKTHKESISEKCSCDECNNDSKKDNNNEFHNKNESMEEIVNHIEDFESFISTNSKTSVSSSSHKFIELKKYCHFDTCLEQDEETTKKIISEKTEEFNNKNFYSETELNFSEFETKLKKFRNLTNIPEQSKNEHNGDSRKMLDKGVLKILDDINILCKTILSQKCQNSNPNPDSQTENNTSSIQAKSNFIQSKILKKLNSKKSLHTFNKISIDLPDTFYQMDGIHGVIKVNHIKLLITSFIEFEVYTICEGDNSLKVIMNQSFDNLTENFMTIFRVHSNHGIFTKKGFYFGIQVKLMDSQKKVLKTEFKEYSIIMEKNKQPTQYFVVQDPRKTSRWKFKKFNFEPYTSFSLV